jgi:thiamine-phosphate pyrophosphorylase
MTFELTPAAQRAFAAAALWSGPGDVDGVAPPELLLGLLSEAESRAAGMLADHGITAEMVQSQWPGLRLLETPSPGRVGQFSADVEMSLFVAADRLGNFPRPLVFATEHILLGLIAAGHELSAWLVQRGFSADDLETEIHRLYGYESGRTVWEEAEPDELGGVSHPMGKQAAAGERSGVSPPVGHEVEGGGASAERGALSAEHKEDFRSSLLRILDAAANRAREGLRVVEDYVRFALDDRHLTSELKLLRHALTAALARLPSAELLAARDTQADVGCELTTAAERARPDMASVVAANFKRLQESLRSLEEFGKVIDPELGGELERLRYRGYTLERAVETTRNSVERLAGARLYVLVDGRTSLAEFEAHVAALVATGVGAIQLRDKHLADRELHARARRLRELTCSTKSLFIMNDRPDLAVLAGADGVHIGQEELTVHDARAIVGARMLIGVSTHSLAQARAAVLDGASYIGVGPTFASLTKPFDPAQLTGLDLLRAVAAEIRLPAFAIGGIDCDSLRDVLSTGFTRVAVSGAVASAADPAAAARELLRRLN